MQQKLIDSTLYVFQVEPYEITEDTSAEIIKVQEESYPGFVELNPTLEDKLVKYNYKVICVNEQEWMPYVDQDDPSQKEDPELAWSTDSATVTIGADDNIFPTLSNPHSVEVTYSSSDTEKATIDGTTGEITLIASGDTTISAIFAGNDTYEAQTVAYPLTVHPAGFITYQHWGDSDLQDYERFLSGTYETPIVNTDPNYYNNFTLTVGSTEYTFDPSNEDQDGYIWDDPTDKNVAIKNNQDAKWPDVYVPVEIAGTDPDWISITAVYVAPEPAQGHTFTLTGNEIGNPDKLSVSFNDVQQEMLYEWTDVAPGTMITIYNTVGASGDYETELQYDQYGHWYVEMPEDDLTVTINYIGGGESGASGES